MLNNTNICGIKLPVSDYILLVEGNLPYNTTEGQIHLEVQTTSDTLELTEIIGCEPVEFSDTYKPWKYGIIFKEKIIYHLADNILASINLRLSKDGKDLCKHDNVRRTFKFELLDNNKVIASKLGVNQMNISHLMFRANQGLPETSEEEGVEVKHNYVL